MTSSSRLETRATSLVARDWIDRASVELANGEARDAELDVQVDPIRRGFVVWRAIVATTHGSEPPLVDGALGHSVRDLDIGGNALRHLEREVRHATLR